MKPGKADLGKHRDSICVSGIACIPYGIFIDAIKSQVFHVYADHECPCEKLLYRHLIKVMEFIVIAKQSTIEKVLRISETR